MSASVQYWRQEKPAFRAGLIVAQDGRGRFKVQFPDRDNIVSGWLHLVVPKTQDDKVFWSPDIGENVICLMDAHDEDGAVLGAAYSKVDMPPPGMTPDKMHVTFRDGTTIEYDRAAHTFKLALCAGGSGTLQTASGGSVVLDSNGNVDITGAQEVNITAPSGNGFTVNSEMFFVHKLPPAPILPDQLWNNGGVVCVS